MSKRPTAKESTFLIRAEPALIENLQHFAARRGCSAAELTRTAIQIHLVSSMLHALDHDEEFVAELRAGKPDVDLDAFRAEAEEDLERLRAHAFPRATALQQLALAREATAA